VGDRGTLATLALGPRLFVVSIAFTGWTNRLQASLSALIVQQNVQSALPETTAKK
jgi:hypothetical protein